MNRSISSRAIRLMILMIVTNCVEEILCDCEITDEDHVADLKKHHVSMTTIMFNHTLSWSPMKLNGGGPVLLYTVEYNFEGDSPSSWCLLETCQNQEKTSCNIDEGNHENFEMGIDFFFRVTGRFVGSNVTVYTTETILFHKYKNLTLTAPTLSLSHDGDDQLKFYPRLDTPNWKGLEDQEIEQLQYQIQYWKEDEENAVVFNVTADAGQYVVIATTKEQNVCARVRLHAFKISIGNLEAFSPWSEPFNCTDSDVQVYAETPKTSLLTEKRRTTVIIPVIVLFVAVVTTLVLCFWKGSKNTCQAITKKTPIPQIIIKNIFQYDASAPVNRNSQYMTAEEVVEKINVFDFQRQSNFASNPRALTPHHEFSFQIEEPDDNGVTVFDMNVLPPHTQFNMTYGIGISEECDHDCFYDDNRSHGIIRATPSFCDRLGVYRNLLSSTSTTSTDLSPAIQDERRTDRRFNVPSVSSTISELEPVLDTPPTNSSPARENLYFNSGSATDRPYFEGMNIAYSSDPGRGVPDLLYIDTIVEKGQQHAEHKITEA